MIEIEYIEVAVGYAMDENEERILPGVVLSPDCDLEACMLMMDDMAGSKSGWYVIERVKCPAITDDDTGEEQEPQADCEHLKAVA